MSWICVNCQMQSEDDSLISCEACGFFRRTEIHLQSEPGNDWHTRIDCDVTRSVYRRLYPGIEHQYVPRNEGEHPYSLCKTTNGWVLRINPSSKLAVKYNDDLCTEDQEYQLSAGDVILLASKEDPSRQVAPLTVMLKVF